MNANVHKNFHLHINGIKIQSVTLCRYVLEAQYNYRFLRYKGKEGLPSAQAAYEQLRSLRWEKPKQSKKPPVA